MHPHVKLFILLTLITNASYAASAEDACMAKATTNYAMKTCSKQARDAAQAELDQLYQQLQDRCNKPDNRRSKTITDRLVTSQKTWVDFRNANCSLLATEMLDGSGEGLMQSECLVKATTDRIIELKTVSQHWGPDDC